VARAFPHQHKALSPNGTRARELGSGAATGAMASLPWSIVPEREGSDKPCSPHPFESRCLITAFIVQVVSQFQRFTSPFRRLRRKPPDDLTPGSIFIFLRVFGAFLFHRTVVEPACQPKLLSDASPKAEPIIIIPGSCYRTGVVCPYKNAQLAQERNTLPRTARGRKPVQFSPCQRRSP
jgi:hypothetical protein